MKVVIFTIILFTCSNASCQIEATSETESTNNNSISKIFKLTDSKLSTKAINNGIELEIKKYKDSLNQELNVEKLLLEIEYLKKVDASYKETILELKNEVEKDINKHENFIISRMNLYTFVFVSIIGLLAFIFNFFGKAAIKKRVEEIIQTTAENYAENKVNEVVENKLSDGFVTKVIRSKGDLEIVKLLGELAHQGQTVISNIKKDGDKIINSVSAAPGGFSQNAKGIVSSNREEITDNNKNTIRTIEQFNIAFNTKDPKIKINLYNNIIEQEPKNWRALNNLGAAYNELLDFNKAIEFLNKGIRINDNFSLLYANRANSFNQLNNPDKAINDANKAILLDVRNELAYSIKGNILTKMKQYEEAKNVLNKAIEINPISSHAYFNRAFFNEEIGNYDLSFTDYLKAKKLGYPSLEILYNNLAVLRRRTKNYNKALEYLDNAKTINPDWPNIYGTQALIYADMKDDNNFYKYLKIALDKGCPVWNYLSDTGFDNYRDSEKLKKLIKSYKDSVDSNDK